MQQDDEGLAWMVLTRAPRLNVARLMGAFARLGHDSATRLMAASHAEHRRLGLEAATCEFLAAAAPSVAERRWRLEADHHVIACTDARYPPVLAATARPPLALYVVGDAACLNERQIAVVGSRNPTPAGRETAFEFAQSLAAFGLTVTSGLAAGIDSAAHRGALAAQGHTIAVLGNGVDRVYPRANRTLSENIAQSGAVISEFALGTPPRAENFPRRNRIIAALTLGTLVVEATPRSGSLLTARLALEHNRALFAVPGPIRSPLSRGCHELIRNGAKLTESTADILRELGFSPLSAPAGGADSGPETCVGTEAGMDKDHKILLDALGFDFADLDILVSRTGLKPETVSSMMLILELKGHVQAAPGGRFSRVRSRGER